MRPSDVEAEVRAACMALPGVTEKLSHGTPAFSAGRQFLMLWTDGHHDHRFPHLWVAAPAGAQEALVASTPDRYFRPPYVGSRGWLGVRLDGPVDVAELQSLCEEGYRTVASKALVARLDATSG